MLLNYLVAVSNTTDSPPVHSFSYGVKTSGVGVKCGAAIIAKIDTELQKAGVRRQTMLFATGDAGAQGWYPASSPFATAVGGTHLATDLHETAWEHSGGGFEGSIEARPDWQAKAVAAYLANTSVPHSKPTDGRGYPDVSAFSTNVCAVVGGEFGCRATGTSAATPIVAGIVSLLNGAR
jgi:tripeptidyl-peptidase-1